MYHCHVYFYLIGGPCRVFDIIKEAPSFEHFTHEFEESGRPEETLTARADVMIVNLRNVDKTELEQVFSQRKTSGELILLVQKNQISSLTEYLPRITDLWVVPMSDEEIRFRFLKWQGNYKTGKDFWETSQYLEETINHIPNLIWYKDKNGVHKKVNESFCQTVNKTKEQVEGQRHAYIWDVEQDDPACIESELEVMTKRETCISEEIVKAGDGNRLLTTYKSPLYDIDGSVMGTVGVAIDVTRERNYEQEIIRKNHTLEMVFTAMDCGVMCHSMDGSRIISINRAALEILGYDSQDEMLEDGFDMVAASVVKEDREILRKCIQSLKKEGDSTGIEYRVQHKDGEYRYVMGNVKLIEENGELFCQRFLLDCTAQKLKEKEKERHQAELLHALSIDYNLVCFFNLDTAEGKLIRISDDNDIFDYAFGNDLRLEESMERYIERFVYEEDQNIMRRESTCERLKKELSEKRQHYVNHRVVKGDNMKYFQMKVVRAGNWETGHGVVLGLRSVDEEIRHEMEQKSLLEDALDQANKANRAKSTFLSNMSHDIRTPMNAIVGFTTLAIRHIDQKNQVEEYLKKIMTSGNHLLGLINDVLDMSRIESGKMRLEEKSCSLPDILQGLNSILQADIRAKGQKFQIDVDDIMNEEIFCDRLRLNQVLLNLLSNAVKYTQKGGHICLQLTQKGAAPIGYGNYEFLIRDDGIGMSEDFLNHIFEPFEREKSTTISRIQGTGLGMAITKNIVDMMKGTIEVSSRQGQGTEVKVSFTFRLSAADSKETAEHGWGDGQETDTFAGGRILLAEDNELNQEIAAAILSDAGFTTEIASDGQIAVDMVKRSLPGYYQLILMDIQMPVMDGYEAARRIRNLENKELASIPILAMTANAFEEDKQEAVKSGMNAHIAKPIDIENLFHTLRMVLNGTTF